MSKITLSVIVYAPCLNKTTIKSNKKQVNSSADTFFWMTRYQVKNGRITNRRTQYKEMQKHIKKGTKLIFSFFRHMLPCTMVQNRKKHSKNSHLIIYFPMSSGVSKRVSTAVHMSEASRVEQANK